MVNSTKKSKQKERLNRDHTTGRSTNHINLYDHTMKTMNIKLKKTQVNLNRVGRSYLNFPKPEIGSVNPNWFEGIGQFPGTYHITLHDDTEPVVHVPRKCPIAMQPLVCVKLDEFIDQGIIVQVEEPTDWVSSLAYS